MGTRADSSPWAGPVEQASWRLLPIEEIVEVGSNGHPIEFIGWGRLPIRTR